MMGFVRETESMFLESELKQLLEAENNLEIESRVLALWAVSL